MRVMQDGAAEDEADRLSAGVNTGSLSGVKSEMGSRLGADFSGVRFHSDAASRARGDAMGEYQAEELAIQTGMLQGARNMNTMPPSAR